MATASVSNTITDQAGTAIPGVNVSVSLQPDQAAWSPGHHEITSVKTTTDAAGLWTLALERTDTMTPTGGWTYRVQEAFAGNGSTLPFVRVYFITVPGAGPYTVDQVWQSSSGAVPAVVSGITNVLAGTGIAITNPTGPAVTITNTQSGRLFVDAVADIGLDPTGVTATDTLLNNAITALPAQGGAIYVPKGLYKVSAGWLLNKLAPVEIYLAPGARLQAGANGVTLVTIHQGPAQPGASDNYQTLFHGGTLDPNGKSNIIGLQVINSGGVGIADVMVYDGALVGFDFLIADTSAWCEALVVRRCWVTAPTVGYRWHRTGGQNSFAEGYYDSLRVTNQTQHGFQFGDTSGNQINMVRSRFLGCQTWLSQNNSDGYFFSNCDFTGTELNCQTESQVASGPTAAYHLNIDNASGAVVLSGADIKSLANGFFTGTGIRNPANIPFLLAERSGSMPAGAVTRPQGTAEYLLAAYDLDRSTLRAALRLASDDSVALISRSTLSVYDQTLSALQVLACQKVVKRYNPAFGAAPDIASSANIDPYAASANVQRFAPTAARTGLTVSAPTNNNTDEMWISNEAAVSSGFTMTFAATASSNMLRGTSEVIQPATVAYFVSIAGAWTRQL